MIGLILVTHGALADEFIQAMQHVVGRQADVAAICIGPNDDMERRRNVQAELGWKQKICGYRSAHFWLLPEKELCANS